MTETTAGFGEDKPGFSSPPPSTLTKPSWEISKEGRPRFTTLTGASLDKCSPSLYGGRGLAGGREDGCSFPTLELSPPSCAVLGTGQAFVKSWGEPDPLS